MKDQQRVVFISGGASGIGLALARHFSRQGAGIAVFDLHISEAVREELHSSTAHAACCFQEVDVREASALAAAAGQAIAALGPPSLAVNSAGIQIAAPFAEISAEQFYRVLDINLMGSRNFAAAVLPHMQRGSKLALVASLAGLVSNYHYSAYCASKFGVVGLAGALRLECLPRGIDVAAICPPEVATPMVEEEMKTMDPVTRELKQVAGTLDLATACSEIIEGLESDEFLVIPGTRARMVARLSRLFPGLIRRKTDKIIMNLLAATS